MLDMLCEFVVLMFLSLLYIFSSHLFLSVFLTNKHLYKSLCIHMCVLQSPGMVRFRTLETVIHKMEESAQDITELQSQVGLKHSAMMTERELAADARDQTLKSMYY